MQTQTFNLSAPPDSRGIDPDLPVRIYQRHLPHWRQNGATNFVTFRLADSIPQKQLDDLKRWREIWERSNPPPRSEQQWHELAREITKRTEHWMDEGYGECYFRDAANVRFMSDAFVDFQKYDRPSGPSTITNQSAPISEPNGETLSSC